MKQSKRKFRSLEETLNIQDFLQSLEEDSEEDADDGAA
jgi:hypothetical protein